MSATDPAVTAAAEAMRHYEATDFGERAGYTERDLVRAAEVAVAAARPIIEAEQLRSWLDKAHPDRYADSYLNDAEFHALAYSIGRIIEAEVREEYDLAMIRRDGSTYARLRDRWEKEVRERIAADIEAEARQVLTDDGAGQVERAALLDAARIARGQS